MDISSYKFKIIVSLWILVIKESSFKSRVRVSNRVWAVVDGLFFHLCCVVQLNGPNLNWVWISVLMNLCKNLVMFNGGLTVDTLLMVLGFFSFHFFFQKFMLYILNTIWYYG